MSRITPPASPRGNKANSELLQKGLLLAFIGLAVLVGPAFMGPSGMRDMVARSAVVGWFALVLGGAFVVLYGVRRRAGRKP